jgi:hypothetical protein
MTSNTLTREERIRLEILVRRLELQDLGWTREQAIHLVFIRWLVRQGRMES